MGNKDVFLLSDEIDEDTQNVNLVEDISETDDELSTDYLEEEISLNANEEVESKYSQTLLHEGNVVYKANALANLIHNSSKLSTHRVTRLTTAVSSHLTLEDDDTTSIDSSLDENCIFITDILATLLTNKSDSGIFIGLFAISKIISSSNNCPSIKLEDMSKASFSGTVLSLTSWDKSKNKIEWDGKYLPTIKNVDGSLCMTIKPHQCFSGRNLKFEILMSEITNIKEYFQTIYLQNPKMKLPVISFIPINSDLYAFCCINLKLNENTDYIPCLLCNRRYKLDRMRLHIGIYLI